MSDAPGLRIARSGPYVLDDGVPVVRLERTPEGWSEGAPLVRDGEPCRLCRCGRTATPPFCDDDHQGLDWSALDRLIPVPRPVSWDVPAAAPSVAVKPDGPLRVHGVALSAEDGTRFEPADRFSLCCCGRSNTPPFCDGSHKEVVGFSPAARPSPAP